MEPKATYHATLPARNALDAAHRATMQILATMRNTEQLLERLSLQPDVVIDDEDAARLEELLDAAWLTLQRLSQELDPWLAYRMPLRLPCPETEEAQA